MGFPLTYLLVAAVLFDIPASECMRVLLSPMYYFVALWVIAAGYGLWEMRRWGWYIFLVAEVAIIYENAYLVSNHSESHHKIVAFALSVVFVGFIFIRAKREIRVPYFFPRIPWWESNPRYKIALPVKLSRGDGALMEGEILDLSMGGCFIKLRTDFEMNEVIAVKFSVFGRAVECEGNVVWRTQTSVTHPKGVGVKFRPFKGENRKFLRQVTLRLQKITALYRRSRYLRNQDEFIKTLEELQSPIHDGAASESEASGG